MSQQQLSCGIQVPFAHTLPDALTEVSDCIEIAL